MTGVTITIDAAGRTLGRVASEAAKSLRGKDDVAFVRNKANGPKVNIVNAAKLHVTAKKKIAKKYARYSGYPGGLRYQALGELAAKKGYGEVLREAIHSMLPNNKLRKEIMKKLEIHE